LNTSKIIFFTWPSNFLPKREILWQLDLIFFGGGMFSSAAVELGIITMNWLLKIYAFPERKL
jgi:hypothetical protein